MVQIKKIKKLRQSFCTNEWKQLEKEKFGKSKKKKSNQTAETIGFFHPSFKAFVVL